MAFVTEAALIALREGLEALLITGILLGLVTRLGRPDVRKHVWAGFAAAVGTSVLAGWAIQRYLLTAFEERGWGAAFELVAALAAVATLLYMVFWMWSHTAKVLSEAKDRVKTALTTGSLATIVFITYISTVREGLETVLFYSALTGQDTVVDILASGALGFAASAILVYVILRTTRNVSVRRFFTATGLWLIIVAAMLTTHAVSAATELGLLDPAPAIWDTSAFLAADSVLGRILHAAVGYMPAPTLLQALTYFGTLFGAGLTYLYQQGTFTQNTTDGREPLTRRVATAAIAVLLVGSLVATAAANPTDRMIAGHSHGGEDAHADAAPTGADLPEDLTVGVMLRSHGEPVHYNATTYESFADFTRKLLIQLGFEQLLAVDQGTVLLDRAHPYTEGPHVDAELIDAWLGEHTGPAAYVGNPVDGTQPVPVFEDAYLAPGGPGLGEPDVLEAAGLGIFTDYLQMENDSPMHDTKQAIIGQVEATLNERFGDKVVTETAYHIQPMVDPGEENLSKSVEELLAQGVDVVVDAYTSHLHSDIMNECMKKQAFRAALAEHGYDGPVLEAGPSGLTATFAEGMADAIATKAAAYPDDARLWVSLTHHGADPDMQSYCRDRADPYVAQTHTMFDHVSEALDNRTLGPNVTVQMVYGSGAGDASDGIYSPTEAVENASAWDATHLMDVPYELPGNGFDNLVQHRLNYDLDPRAAPHYDETYTTHLTREGMAVTITSSDFARETRAQAQVEAIVDAMAPLFEPSPEDDTHDHDG